MIKQDETKVKETLKLLKENNVQFLKLWFTDILGNVKSLSISHREFEHALRDGMGFDGSSVEGFARIFESDLLAVPDLDTFRILPWKFMDLPMARMFCNIHTPDGKQYEGDPRYILKKNIDKAKAMGFTSFKVGPELEYFYFKNDENPVLMDKGGYFDTVPVDDSHDLRRETMTVLDAFGIHVEYAHHEVAPSQHEIDLRYDDALKMADNVITYKIAVKQVAKKNGCYATFMPKPIMSENGSGMHIHQSLFKGDANAFFDGDKPYRLSDTARSYVAGILRHSRGICAITNQWVNSYKRLVPGYEAPVYICWANRNRSALIRVPQAKGGHPNSSRIESRFPDPACNPYLAFSVMLAAGLDGIKNNIPLVPAVEVDVFKMDEIERKANKIETLPDSLITAVEAMEQSALAKECLGEELFNKFIVNKKIEWNNFRRYVTDYEIKNYLPLL